MEELPTLPCPASLGCPGWGLHSRAAPWAVLWVAGHSESSHGDKTGLMWFLLQLLLRNKELGGSAGLWGLLCCLFSAPAQTQSYTGLSWVTINLLLLQVAAAEGAVVLGCWAKAFLHMSHRDPGAFSQRPFHL